ncbi:protein ImuB [Halospina denitrificans]|uniref:Protein ImuB n=1 Tax=Halospina denitrificans TaxID=332522 RepID=A0A4V6Q2J6_9GAMM|nr:DNA polymerase Y family protein [Halospina denitrificans]TDT39298.1 protein ImuB [Halospina denitrificans]
MLWLYIHFPLMLADHYRTRTAGAPVALTRGTPPVVTQACSDAHRAGVQPGQSLATAQGLCPELNLFPFRERAQTRVLEQLATAMYRFLSPLTLWEPDGLLTQADQLGQLYESLEALTGCITRELRGMGFHCRPATGTTPRMARLLARHSGFCSEDGPALMKATRALPVTATDWPASVKQRLNQMGLHTLGDLLNCCSNELASRLGPELQEDLQRILGKRAEPLDEFHPPDRFHQYAELPQETRSVDRLRFPLEHLFRALEHFLREHQYACGRIRVTLHHPDRPATPLELRTARQEYQAEAFLELALLHLNAMKLEDDVQALSIDVSHLVSRDREATDLFGNNRTRNEALAALLHRLRARLGADSIHQPGSRADPRPEKALRWRQPGASPDSTETGPIRPVWLQQPPIPLREPPHRWLNGPERIQGGWWDGDYVRRDYYIAVLASGRCAWLYRNHQRQWFIHGWFG